MRLASSLHILFRNNIFRMATSKLDNITLQSLNNRVTFIERQIASLSSELADIKKILNEHSNEKITPISKRRKLDEKIFSTVNYSSFTQKDENNFTVDSDGYVQVYTDGACENNGKSNARAGLGVWFGPNHPLNLSEPVKRRPTNNVSEIEGCTRAIQVAHSAGVTKLCINTDSEFAINCITKWIHGWRKNGWKTAKGVPVINKDELIELDQTLQLMSNVKWNHVRGHNGIVGNEGADELARRGAQMYKKTR